MKRSGRLQREIRQTRPFANRAQEATLGILRTADVVRRGIVGVLSPHGLSPQQYNVLRILRGAGEEGIPTLEIASRMIERAPGITRLLDGLERKGLARRERCPHDRRQVLCHLTPLAAELLAKLDAPVVAADSGRLETLDTRDLATLIRLLDAVRAAAAGETETPSRPKTGRRSKGDPA